MVERKNAPDLFKVVESNIAPQETIKLRIEPSFIPLKIPGPYFKQSVYKFLSLFTKQNNVYLCYTPL